MPEARAHHFLPVFYLKGFTDRRDDKAPGEGVLWVYSKDKPTRKSKPSEEAHQRDLYSFKDSEGKRQSIEEGLSKIESDMAPIFRKVTDDSNEITLQEAAEIAGFATVMWARGPAAKDYLDQVATSAIKASLLKRAADEPTFMARYEELRQRDNLELSAEEARNMILSGDWEITQNSPGYNLKMMFNAVENLTPVLTAKAWDVLTISGNGFFCAGDNPVVTLVPKDGEATLGVGFGTPGVEVYFPLDSRNCFVASDRGLRERLEVTPEEVRQINEILMLHATRFAYAKENNTAIEKFFKESGCKIVKGQNAFLPPTAL
jgi:hypothetical protein